MRDVLPRAVLLALAALAAGGVPSAAGAPYGLGPQTLVSGPSPFAGCIVGSAGADSVVYTDTEVEPQVAVNPTELSNVIGSFQQDRWSDGGARGLVAARSFDGGSSWARNFAPFSACSGGAPEYRRATDPWVSFDRSGRAYQISLSIDSAELGLSAVLASTSANGGASWSAPKTISRDEDPLNFNVKESITGDPTRASTAYATWIRGAFPSENPSLSGQAHAFSYRGQPMFSRTADGGQTWSAPVPMTNQNIYAQGNQIAVLPDGTLVRSGPVAIDRTPGRHAFNHAVTVTADGTVAVLYYDFRNNTPAAGLPTDVWLTSVD